MNSFPQLLKARRKELKLTQGKLAMWLQKADTEFSGVDVVSISRWEMGKIQPSLYKMMKILSIIGVDLYPFIQSLDISVEDNVIQKVLEKRFQSFHSVITTANYSRQQKQEISIECYPLLRNANDGQVLAGIHNLASHLKINTQLLNLVDMYLYQMTQRIYGRKFISTDDGEMQGHNLGFFFNNDEFDQFQPKKVDFTQATPYSDNKELVYFVTSSFALSMKVAIEDLLHGLKFISSRPSIKRVAILTINPDVFETQKIIGYETFKFSEECENGSSLELNGRYYNYCVMVIDKLKLLSNKHIVDFIIKNETFTDDYD